MTCTTKVLTALLVLVLAGISRAQTEKPCRILFDNHSRESLRIENVRVLLEDGTLKDLPGNWSIKAGDRVYLLLGDKAVEGRQISYSLRTMDGVISRGWKSTAKQPARFEHDSIIQDWNDEQIGKIRAEDKGRTLSKGEATYRYWNAVHGICLEEDFDSVQNVGSLEFSKVWAYLRTKANRIDDLETEGIDSDAISAAHTWSALLREQVKIMNGRNGAKMATRRR